MGNAKTFLPPPMTHDDGVRKSIRPNCFRVPVKVLPWYIGTLVGTLWTMEWTTLILTFFAFRGLLRSASNISCNLMASYWLPLSHITRLCHNISFADFFTFNPFTVTRGYQYKLYDNHSRGTRKHFFAERVVAPWNSLPAECVIWL